MPASPNIQVLKLQVPADTAWQPQLAQQLMVTLCALPSLTLLVRSQYGEIVWQIEVPRMQAETIIRSLYSVYPYTHVEQSDKLVADIGYYAYPVRAISPFYIPLVYASDCGALDPLTGIVAAMGALAEGEAIAFSLSITPPTRNYQ